MSQLHTTIVDISGSEIGERPVWPPALVTVGEIERAIEHLAQIAPPNGGRRSARIVHPSAGDRGMGFAPGIEVTINVLKPGESTDPIRRNSSQVEICIGGGGVVMVEGGKTLTVQKWDVWNLPSMKAHSYRNTGRDLMAWLAYSDAPVLESLGAHYVEVRPTVGHIDEISETAGSGAEGKRLRDTAANFELPTGGWLRGYQYAVDVDVVETPTLLWRWQDIAPHLPLAGPNHPDIPMMMYLLYNPATERTSGITQSFFTTITCVKANGPRPKEGGRGHRHNSAAINYHMAGNGYSVVDGQRVDWGPGDLLLSAPSWSEHAHYPSSAEMLVLTVQDHPRHMNLGSLIWQEDMTGPILNIGAQHGFNSASPRNDIQQ